MLCVDAKTLSSAVSEKLFSFRELIVEFESELPEYTCENFLKGVKLLLEAIEEYHHGWIQDAGTSKSAEDRIRAVSKICLTILSKIHSDFFPYLSASSRQTPYLIQPCLEKAMRAFQNSVQVDLTLVPQFEYSYGITGMPEFAKSEIEKLVYVSEEQKQQRLEQATTLPGWTAFISYPLVEQDSALKLSVIAHELAHLLDFMHGLYKSHVPTKLDEQSFKQLLERVSAEMATKEVGSGPGLLKRMHNHYYQECNRMVISWLREITADILATDILGPAYFFSFMEFLAHGGFPNRHDRDHPAPALRLKILLDELRYLGYFDTETDIQGELEIAQTRVSEEAASTDYDGVPRVADRTVQPQIPNLLKALRQFSNRYSYWASKYVAEVPELARQIEAGIAPIERRVSSSHFEPAPVIAILNAGWQVYKSPAARFSNLFDSSVPVPKQLATLDHLLLKAMETSELVREWRKQ